jgi:hypothetical protein
MVAPAAPAALHLLTPGSPAYAMLKVGAIGGIVALRFALFRKKKDDDDEPGSAEPGEARRAPSHPVSRKKQRRRRR